MYNSYVPFHLCEQHCFGVGIGPKLVFQNCNSCCALSILKWLKFVYFLACENEWICLYHIKILMQTATVNSEFKPMRKFVKLIVYLNASLNTIGKKMLQGTSTEKDGGGGDNFQPSITHKKYLRKIER